MNSKVRIVLEGLAALLLSGVLAAVVFTIMTADTRAESVDNIATTGAIRTTPARVTEAVIQVATSAAPVSATQPGTITAVGEGVVIVKPDFARAEVGVETIAPTIAEATRTNDQAMAAVIATLKNNGIAADAIQTTNYGIAPERSYGGNGVDTIIGYRVSNMVQITIHDLAQVGPILDDAIRSGANTVFGVSFGLNAPTRAHAEAEAREQAMADLHDRAAALAQLSSVRLGYASLSQRREYFERNAIGLHQR